LSSIGLCFAGHLDLFPLCPLQKAWTRAAFIEVIQAFPLALCMMCAALSWQTYFSCGKGICHMPWHVVGSEWFRFSIQLGGRGAVRLIKLPGFKFNDARCHCPPQPSHAITNWVHSSVDSVIVGEYDFRKQIGTTQCEHLRAVGKVQQSSGKSRPRSMEMNGNFDRTTGSQSRRWYPVPFAAT